MQGRQNLKKLEPEIREFMEQRGITDDYNFLILADIYRHRRPMEDRSPPYCLDKARSCNPFLDIKND